MVNAEFRVPSYFISPCRIRSDPATGDLHSNHHPCTYGPEALPRLSVSDGDYVPIMSSPELQNASPISSPIESQAQIKSKPLDRFVRTSRLWNETERADHRHRSLYPHGSEPSQNLTKPTIYPPPSHSPRMIMLLAWSPLSRRCQSILPTHPFSRLNR